jgi:hypothetical protein
VMIDVEGAEIDVLDGMRQALVDHHPVVCCEVHWLGERFLEYCSNVLRPLGYGVRNLDGGPPPKDGFHRWHAVLSHR